MISFDPHNNPVRQANWHQHHLTEGETATQRNKGLAQGHSSQVAKRGLEHRSFTH